MNAEAREKPAVIYNITTLGDTGEQQLAQTILGADLGAEYQAQLAAARQREHLRKAFTLSLAAYGDIDIRA